MAAGCWPAILSRGGPWQRVRPSSVNHFTNTTIRLRTLACVACRLATSTKRAQAAGPKDLEHNIDAMIYLRLLSVCGHCSSPKAGSTQRFDPLVLTTDNNGHLLRAPYTTAQSFFVRTQSETSMCRRRC